MDLFEIVSVNVGRPINIGSPEKELWTGICKNSLEEPIFLSFINLEGDEQADLVHHGGRDKAVCVYSYNHYSYWETEIGHNLAFGAFGENVTVKGLVEQEVFIGDIYQWGEAIVQVSQPRQPCHKLAKRYDLEDLPLRVQQTGFTGFYFRVIQEGAVAKEAGLKLLEHHPERISVSFANQIMHHEKQNAHGIKRILGIQELSESWRKTLFERLERI